LASNSRYKQANISSQRTKSDTREALTFRQRNVHSVTGKIVVIRMTDMNAEKLCQTRGRQQQMHKR